MPLRNWLRNAFAVEPEAGLSPTPEERALVDRVVRAVIRRGLSTPAILALQCSHNLNFLAGQTLLFFNPLLGALFNGREIARFAGFLERRGSIEYMCRLIERYEEQGTDSVAAPDKPETRQDAGTGNSQ